MEKYPFQYLEELWTGREKHYDSPEEAYNDIFKEEAEFDMEEISKN